VNHDREAPSDQELVARCRAGDQRAFELLVRRYQRKVYAIAYGVVHDSEDALDVTQEAFIKVHRYLDKFQGTASFYTWLYRLVVNVSIDHLRRGRKAQVVEYDDGIDRSGSVLSADAIVPSSLGTNPAKVLEDKRVVQAISEGLKTLSANHRAVLVMRELEGLSYKEMAEIMQVSKGTIMSRLFHARKRMQAYLSQVLNDSDSESV
jgi:RNA polymerase sigma-70 factor (ECF subfamily)